ncbi:MAG: GMP synthase [Saprospirales bacterium]|nr:GMP synthase [Saprospirales bacterium]MBK8491742.1 GMP synthase [Saprospirales bacterium]
MASIEKILGKYRDQIDWVRFDVRQRAEVPAIEDFDLFISSGGPGNPLEGDGVWDRLWHGWVDELWEHNLEHPEAKKFAFFICHSFQMLCHHFHLGDICARDAKSFGTFPVHLTDAALVDPIFKQLPNPFYAADFRDFQVVRPDVMQCQALGVEILALEKVRPHLPEDRALMAIRFSEEILGVQFHPEAHVRGMLSHFQEESRMVHVINHFGKKKYEEMIKDLSDPAKIQLTHDVILPTFLEKSMESLKEHNVLA